MNSATLTRLIKLASLTFVACIGTFLVLSIAVIA